MDLQLFRYLLHLTVDLLHITYASCFSTVDTILRLAHRFSSLPLFHYGLRCGVLTTLYIQRLSL